MDSSSAVKSFYTNRSILVTGVTGFVGKVLLEKIIRSIPQISKIYILIRAKKGLTPEERVHQLLRSPTFTFHYHSNEALAKVIPVEGDISLPFLGLSHRDQLILKNEVSVVFHAAASIRFDSKLADHLQTNVLGTKYLLDLCKQMKKLDCLVSVSTAYSNCHLREIDEQLYPLPHTPQQVLQLHEILDPDSLEKLVPTLIDGRPNTYVYSKALAEHLICSEMDGYTVAIARPAIVGPSISEPAKGWVDSLHGPAGLSLCAGLGIIQTMDWEHDIYPDAIAVDHLSNALIASAWHMFTYNPSQHKIFNFTSSNLRPMTSGQFMAHARNASIKYPSIYIIRPIMHPPKGRINPTLFNIQRFFYHVIFAYFIDFFIGLAGREKIMVRVVNRMHNAIDLMQYFALRDWKFTSNNFLKLIEDLKGQDANDFNPDLRTVEDDVKAIEDLWLGCRRYILKEPDENITLARQKYMAVVTFYRIYQMFLIFLAYKLLVVWTPVAAIFYQSILMCGNSILQMSGFISTQTTDLYLDQNEQAMNLVNM